MSKIVMLAGPIKHWWDDNWETPEHWAYQLWRDQVSYALVSKGYLVYRPHEAFKGPWNEQAQIVNDAAMVAADFIINLTPPGVPSVGTDDEMIYANLRCRARVINAPPPAGGEFPGLQLNLLFADMESLVNSMRCPN